MTASIRSLCILAGLAATPAVLAQAITLDAPGGGVIAVGETVTVTMSASYGGTDYAIAGIATGIRINESQGEFTNLRLVAPMAGPGTTPGVLGAGGIDGIIAGQLNFPTAQIYADPTNPIAFWQADFTVGALVGGVALDIETVTTRYDVYVAREQSRSESRLADLEEGRLVIVVPAPAGAFALLGGLAMAGRRRR
jgi:hypothetical protein